MKKATANRAAGADALAGADLLQPDHIPDTPYPPTVLPLDEFHGLGGDYVMENGVRHLADASAESSPPAAA